MGRGLAEVFKQGPAGDARQVVAYTMRIGAWELASTG